MSMRCEHCNGSGLSDKEGPRDDELLDRVVLSALAISEMQDELDRLRAENERLEHEAANWCPDHRPCSCAVEIDRLRAENEKMRGLLKIAAKGGWLDLDEVEAILAKTAKEE